MRAEDLLTEERRARMAAEKLLAQKEAELQTANRMLSRHAVSLTEDLVEKREEIEEVKGENSRVRGELEKATEEVAIAKRRLWNSIQNIDDGFAVFDESSRLVIANAAYLAPFDGLECIRPGAHYEEVLEAAISEGVVDIEGMSPAQYRDTLLARWRSPEPTARVIRLWDGAHVRLVDTRAPGGDTVSLALNITDSVRREKVLKKARDRAEAASRAKSAFLANMSHEIRTPMNGVVGMADLLAGSPLDDEQQLYVDTIRSSGQALLTIINDVLDYSKIEAAKLTLHAEPFDLERTILEVVQLLSPSIREKKLKVMVDYDMFLPTRFVGDQVRVRQVLTNLMGNAVKFTQKGHVLVRVLGLPVDGGKAQRVHVTVEDTGIGIARDQLSHVFGEFNQVESERNRSYEGTGLGLSITQKLIRLMGGEIWADSDLGVGSVFGFHLTMPVAGEGEAPTLPDWLSRALLVMDDDLNRTILEKRLIALGLEVEAVGGGTEAAPESAAAADVIFADYRMADMPASAFLALMRENGVRAPVVLLTTPTGAPDSPLPGAAGLLAKPISRPDLVRTLLALPAPAEEAEPAPTEDMTEAEPAETPDESDAADTQSACAPRQEFIFGSRRVAVTGPVFESRRRAESPAATDPAVDEPRAASSERDGGPMDEIGAADPGIADEKDTAAPSDDAAQRTAEAAAEAPDPYADREAEAASPDEPGDTAAAISDAPADVVGNTVQCALTEGQEDAALPAPLPPTVAPEPPPGADALPFIAEAQTPEAGTTPAPVEMPPDAAPEAQQETALDQSLAATLPPDGPAAPDAPEAVVETSRRMRVLAAEDNRTNRLVFSKLVKACDIDLTFATDGEEAVAAYEKERPDLVFMDISMPGVDGKEATRRIRDFEAKAGLGRTRIVALTAHAMDGDAEEIMAHGLDAYLTKPFKKPAILAEIGVNCPDGVRPPLPASDALPEALADVAAKA